MSELDQILDNPAPVDKEGEGTPDPYELSPENKAKISARIDKKLQVDKFARSQFERSWFINIAMNAGQHDLMFYQGRLRLRQVPSWYPRTKTNKFKEKSRDLISALLTGRVPIKYLPATDDPEAQNTAEVGERVREVIYEEAKIDHKEGELAAWFINTGNAFLIPYYDYDPKHGQVETPKLECPQCGTTFGFDEIEDTDGGEVPNCPKCAEGGELDETGQQNPPSQQVPLQQSEETELTPIGALCADPCSPFEIRADSRIRDYRDWKWFIRQRRYDLGFAKDKWNYTGEAGDGEELKGSLSQHYLDVISQINNNYDPQTSLIGTTGGASVARKVTAYEYYQLPDDDYPEGVRAVRLGSGAQNVVEFGPLTTEYGAGIRKGQKFLPIIHLRAEVVPGRMWGATPLDDAVSLQLFRNVVERVIKLETQRMANSVWLLPKGCGIELTNGEPGWNASYNPITLGGTTPVKPERLPPQLQHLNMLLELLKFIDDEIERVTGTYFLTGGEAPSGVSAACLSDDTECLTKRGWKKYFDLRDDDEIYTFDPNDNKGKWSPLLALNVYNYKGEMYHVDGREVDAIATPNHNWFVQDNNKQDDNYFTRRMDKMSTSVSLPASAVLDKNDEIEKDDFVELMGWIVTDGSYDIKPVGQVVHDKRGDWTRRTEDCTIDISQSRRANPEKCVMIENCLRRLGINFSDTLDKRTQVSRFRFSGKLGREIVNRFPNKLLTEDFIVSLSQRQLLLLYKTMMLGDGNSSDFRGDMPHKTRCYTSFDPRLAHQMQMVATLAGLPNTMLIGKPDPIRTRHKKPCYTNQSHRVIVKQQKHFKWRALLKHTKKFHYEGIVWCPTTSTGTWVARRNGKVYVTGNSALALLDDRAKKGMSPMVKEWAKGFLAFDEMALELARQNWTDARIRVIAGKNRTWETSSFMSADLQGAVNMVIDYASLFPKSAATERAEIQQLIQGMVLNPQDPETKMQILKKFGMMGMLGSYDLDVKQAQKEWAAFLQSGKPPQLVPLVQNSLAHFLEHCDVTKTDEFDALPEEQKQLWYAHIQATAVDMGERRALFAQMGLNPDAPQAEEIGTGAAQSAIQGAQQVMPDLGQPPQPQSGGGGGAPGSQVGSGGPSKPSPKKGTTGAGPNQAQAQQRLADIGASMPPIPGQ